MPANASIIVTDGETTPVSHTYVVHTGQNGNDPAVNYDKSLGIFTGFERLTTLVRRSESNKATRISIQLSRPTLAVTAPSTGSGIQPNPTVAYTCLGKVDLVFPDSCTLQERRNMRRLIGNLMVNTTLASAIEDLAPMY